MTRTLTLKNCFQGNSTIVENDFIDHYLAKANGEYVKVYLLLLRHLSAGTALSIAGLADFLECTEKDILRAFKHWSKVGLLNIDYDAAGNICGLAIGKDAKPSFATSKSVDTKPVVSKLPPANNPEDLKQLYFVAEQYLGKPLTATDIKKINYFFDSLKFSVDLIEYLIEYCVENGHRNFRYIESVALAWAEEGVQTVEEAKVNSALYNKNCYSVLNAFGIKGRGPAPIELSYIKKWSEEYGFTLDIIIEACNRTIQNTHKPDFKYADSILTSWSTKGVHHLADISKADAIHRQEKETKKRVSDKPSISPNRFTNFEGRTLDFDSLEQQLLNIN